VKLSVHLYCRWTLYSLNCWLRQEIKHKPIKSNNHLDLRGVKCSLDIIRTVELGRIRWTGYVARIGDKSIKVKFSPCLTN
jgi:hypothetical protein